MLIVAGPGTGKTRTLTQLLASERATPREALAVTFSVRAAGELRLRLADLLGGLRGSIGERAHNFVTVTVTGGGAAQPAVHSLQCTSSTGLPAISLLTQSTSGWPFTSSV